MSSDAKIGSKAIQLLARSFQAEPEASASYLKYTVWTLVCTQAPLQTDDLVDEILDVHQSSLPLVHLRLERLAEGT